MRLVPTPSGVYFPGQTGTGWSITRAHRLGALLVGHRPRPFRVPGFPTPAIDTRFLKLTIGDALRCLCFLTLPYAVRIGASDNDRRGVDARHANGWRRHDTSGEPGQAKQRNQKASHRKILSVMRNQQNAA